MQFEIPKALTKKHEQALAAYLGGSQSLSPRYLDAFIPGS